MKSKTKPVSEMQGVQCISSSSLHCCEVPEGKLEYVMLRASYSLTCILPQSSLMTLQKWNQKYLKPIKSEFKTI